MFAVTLYVLSCENHLCLESQLFISSENCCFFNFVTMQYTANSGGFLNSLSSLSSIVRECSQLIKEQLILFWLSTSNWRYIAFSLDLTTYYNCICQKVDLMQIESNKIVKYSPSTLQLTLVNVTCLWRQSLLKHDIKNAIVKARLFIFLQNFSPTKKKNTVVSQK